MPRTVLRGSTVRHRAQMRPWAVRRIVAFSSSSSSLSFPPGEEGDTLLRKEERCQVFDKALLIRGGAVRKCEEPPAPRRNYETQCLKQHGSSAVMAAVDPTPPWRRKDAGDGDGGGRDTHGGGSGWLHLRWCAACGKKAYVGGRRCLNPECVPLWKKLQPVSVIDYEGVW